NRPNGRCAAVGAVGAGLAPRRGEGGGSHLRSRENKSPRQCLKEGHCRSLQMTFFACKRSIVSACVVFSRATGLFTFIELLELSQN
uniref:Uncharacterized protein n=1 Tax=Nothoprocta perdicaria TaxID=30464 RepID=A0A8C6YHU8_NOTPE